MRHGQVFQHLISTRENKGGGFLLLIDPDRYGQSQGMSMAEAAQDCGVDAIMVGSSFMLNTNFSKSVKEIKSATNLPVVIFPGNPVSDLRPLVDNASVVVVIVSTGTLSATAVSEQIPALMGMYNVLSLNPLK